MNADRAASGLTAAPRSPAWQRWLGRLIVLLLAVWFAWFAYVRITTAPPLRDPAAQARLQVSPPGAKAWVDVLSKLQPFGTAADADGSRRYVESVRNGPWDPDRRPFLRNAIRVLDSPEFEALRAELTELSTTAWTWSDPRGRQAVWTIEVHPNELRMLTDILTAHARIQHERGDPDAAWRDLATLLNVSAVNSPNSLWTFNSSVLTRHRALRELQHLVRNHPPDRARFAEIAARLDALPPVETFWQAAVRGEIEPLYALVEATYTDDGHGDGWLVLSALPRIRSGFVTSGSAWPPPPAGRSRIWNLLSPLFRGKRAALRRLDELAGAPIPLGPEYLARVNELLFGDFNATPFSALDGPWLALRGGDYPGFYRNVPPAVTLIAWRRATRAVLALECYRAQHGDYPPRLDVLVPEYLEGVPLDPFNGQRFGYETSPARDDYALQSVGVDARSGAGLDPAFGNVDDLTFPPTRPPADDMLAAPDLGGAAP